MPLINMETLAKLYCYSDANEDYKNIYIFGLEEYEEVIRTFIPKCEYKSLSRDKVNELLVQYHNNGFSMNKA